MKINKESTDGPRWIFMSFVFNGKATFCLAVFVSHWFFSLFVCSTEKLHAIFVTFFRERAMFVLQYMRACMCIYKSWWMALRVVVSFPWRLISCMHNAIYTFIRNIAIYMLIWLPYIKIFRPPLARLRQSAQSILIKCLEIISFSFPLFADWNWLHFWFTLFFIWRTPHIVFKAYIDTQHLLMSVITKKSMGVMVWK